MIRILLLGPLSVTIDGTPMPRPKRGRTKGYELLIYLALHPGSQDRSILATKLFDENDENEPGKKLYNLRQVLSALKESLGSNAKYIDISDSSVSLNNNYFSTDLQDFKKYIQQQRWRDALGLVRGPFCDTAEFGSWIVTWNTYIETEVEKCNARLSGIPILRMNSPDRKSVV